MLACQKLPFWGLAETEESKSKGHFLVVCEALGEYCFWSHLDFVKKKMPAAHFPDFQLLFKTRPLII